MRRTRGRRIQVHMESMMGRNRIPDPSVSEKPFFMSVSRGYIETVTDWFH